MEPDLAISYSQIEALLKEHGHLRELVKLAVHGFRMILEYDCDCGSGYQLGNCGCYNFAQHMAEEFLEEAYKNPSYQREPLQKEQTDGSV